MRKFMMAAVAVLGLFGTAPAMADDCFDVGEFLTWVSAVPPVYPAKVIDTLSHEDTLKVFATQGRAPKAMVDAADRLVVFQATEDRLGMFVVDKFNCTMTMTGVRATKGEEASGMGGTIAAVKALLEEAGVKLHPGV